MSPKLLVSAKRSLGVIIEELSLYDASLTDPSSFDILLLSLICLSRILID